MKLPKLSLRANATHDPVKDIHVAQNNACCFALEIPWITSRESIERSVAILQIPFQHCFLLLPAIWSTSVHSYSVKGSFSSFTKHEYAGWIPSTRQCNFLNCLSPILEGAIPELLSKCAMTPFAKRAINGDIFKIQILFSAQGNPLAACQNHKWWLHKATEQLWVALPYPCRNLAIILDNFPHCMHAIKNAKHSTLTMDWFMRTDDVAKIIFCLTSQILILVQFIDGQVVHSATYPSKSIIHMEIVAKGMSRNAMDQFLQW